MLRLINTWTSGVFTTPDGSSQLSEQKHMNMVPEGGGMSDDRSVAGREAFGIAVDVPSGPGAVCRGFVHPWEPRKVDGIRSGAYETVAGPPRVLTSHDTGG